MRTFLAVALILFISSCKQDVTSHAGSAKDMVDAEKEAAIEHLVFFSLKDSLSNEDIVKFSEMLKTLERIEGVVELEINTRHDVNDSRALDYDLLMAIEFEAISYLNTYALDPYHLAVRDSLMPYLVAPPATFDLIPDQ